MQTYQIQLNKGDHPGYVVAKKLDNKHCELSSIDGRFESGKVVMDAGLAELLQGREVALIKAIFREKGNVELIAEASTEETHLLEWFDVVRVFHRGGTNLCAVQATGKKELDVINEHSVPVTRFPEGTFDDQGVVYFRAIPNEGVGIPKSIDDVYFIKVKDEDWLSIYTHVFEERINAENKQEISKYHH